MNRSTTVKRAAGAAVLAGVALSTSGCALFASRYMGSGEPQPPSCGTWGVASASGGGGQTGAPTALDAVVASHNTNGVPRDAWTSTTNADHSITFSFGPTTVHVVKLADGTWFADGGGTCGPQTAAYGSTLELSFSASPSAAPGSPAP